MGARNGRTSALDLRIVLPLRVNLLRFVQKVLALAVIPQGTRAKGAPSRRSSQLPRRRRAPHRRIGHGGWRDELEDLDGVLVGGDPEEDDARRPVRIDCIVVTRQRHDAMVDALSAA
jgi:hypothetical protein